MDPTITLKRAYEYAPIECANKRRKLDYDPVLNLPTEIWEDILKLAIDLNRPGQSVARFGFVCKQWHNCRDALLGHLLHSGFALHTIFATYAGARKSKTDAYGDPALFNKEVVSVLCTHGAATQALNFKSVFFDIHSWDDLAHTKGRQRPDFEAVEAQFKFFLSFCPNLRTLDLSYRHGDLAFLPCYANLQTLRLSRTSCLDDNTMVLLAKCHALQELDVTRTSITHDSFPILSILTRLENLDLSHCYDITADEASYSHLSGLKNLTKLMMSNLGPMGNGMTDECFEFVQNLTNLRVLDISADFITDGSFPILGTLTRLESLDFSECTHVRDNMANYGHLSGLQNLTTLQMSNLEDGITEECFGFVQNLTNLRQLDISICFLDPSLSLPHLLPLSSLCSLKVGTQDDFNFDVCVQALASLTQLTHLDVTTSHFDVQHLEQLARLSRLNTLHLELLYITDEALSVLSNFNSLEHLHLADLEDSLFTPFGFNQMIKLPALKTLDINHVTYKRFNPMPAPSIDQGAGEMFLNDERPLSPMPTPSIDQGDGELFDWEMFLNND